MLCLLYVFVILEQNLPFLQKALLAGVSGALGGLVGTPGDLVNVRMQNDVKVHKLYFFKLCRVLVNCGWKKKLQTCIGWSCQDHQGRRFCKGFWFWIMISGVARLFGGATMATSRAILMTIGQLAFYDQIKQTLLSSGLAQDNLATHFAASITAVGFFSTIESLFHWTIESLLLTIPRRR